MYQNGYFVARNASAFPDRTALVFQDQTFSYAELNARVNKCANALQALGIARGDRVACLMRNNPWIVILFLATQKIGAVFVPLNVRLKSQELEKIATLSRVAFLLYGPDFSTTAEELVRFAPGIRLAFSSAGGNGCEVDFAAHCQLAPATEPQVDIQGGDESLILFTSGTTGIPKCVVRTQQMVRDYALMMAITNQKSRFAEILVTHCPMYHTGGLSVLMKMQVLAGTLVLLDGANKETYLDTIAAARATQVLLIPPILLTHLYRTGKWRTLDLGTVREIRLSGGKVTPECIDQLFVMFPNAALTLSYGSTETCSPTSGTFSREEIEKNPQVIESIGQLNPLCEMVLENEKGEPVSKGEVGEALVRSPMVFSGYVNQPELNKKCLTDGWFHTEDLMRQDSENNYYLVDRKKDMIKTGGENVYSSEVEHVLSSYPSIEECAVIAVADERFGEAVGVVCVPKEGKSIDFEELVAFARERLPHYCQPRYGALVEAIPRNSVGKIQKNVLRKLDKEAFRKIS